MTIDQSAKGILTVKSPDLSKRLSEIKSTYEKDNFKDKLQPNKSDKLSWVPDWNDPKIQVVNDSTSYVFFPLLAYTHFEGKKYLARQVNGRLFLLVKNEREFYKAYYYSPNKQEFDLKSFSGNLLLSGLQNNGNYLLEYENGQLSDSYLKKKMLSLKKIQSIDGSISY